MEPPVTGRSMKRILIIDGITGVGKSSVLREVRARREASGQGPAPHVIFEEETLGQIMEQVRDPDWREAPSFESLERVLGRMERELAAEPTRRFLVERFHLTTYALFPRWERLERFDARLAQLGAAQVLLSYPEALAEQRALERVDRREEQWAEGMDAWYGSRAAAVDAVVRSQRRRWEALRKSALPFLHLDTREGDWPRYATTLLAYWTGATE
jgi:thymidylate kinase